MERFCNKSLPRTHTVSPEMALYSRVTHHRLLAGLRDEFVTALMDQQFAVDTLVALPPQPPYPFTAVATVCLLEGAHRHTTQRITRRFNSSITQQPPALGRQYGATIAIDEPSLITNSKQSDRGWDSVAVREFKTEEPRATCI